MREIEKGVEKNWWVPPKIFSPPNRREDRGENSIFLGCPSHLLPKSDIFPLYSFFSPLLLKQSHISGRGFVKLTHHTFPIFAEDYKLVILLVYFIGLMYDGFCLEIFYALVV